MNIESFKEESDLSKFLKFTKNLSDKITIIYDDWDNMCGITISDNLTGHSSLFNFCDDGKFRCMMSPSPDYLVTKYREQCDKEIKNMSLFKLIKLWWRLQKV